MSRPQSPPSPSARPQAPAPKSPTGGQGAVPGSPKSPTAGQGTRPAVAAPPKVIRTKSQAAKEVSAYGPTADEGQVKGLNDWTEKEVWGWLSLLPYAEKLKKETFDFINGNLLSAVTPRSLRQLGVFGAVVPRLHQDINRKVVELERRRIEAERIAEAKKEEGKGTQQTPREEAVEMVCGCLPKAKPLPKPRKEWKPVDGEPDERHEVRIQLFVNSIGAIDSSTETWEVDFWLRAVWSDDHLFKVRGSDDDFRADWEDPEWFNPMLEVVNAQALDLVMEQKFVDTDEIYLEQRWRGSLQSDMDLHSFPFDQQDLRIDIESSYHAAKVLHLVTAADDAALFSAKCREHSEFKIIRGELETTFNEMEFVTEKDADFQRYSLILHVARRSGFFIGKIGLVNLICVLVGISIAFLDPSGPGKRMGITSTMFLTLVAFQFTIDDVMPKIGYFTLLDYLLYVCYAILMGSILQALLQYQKYLAGVSTEELFALDLEGFIIEVAVLIGVAIFLCLYGVRKYAANLLDSIGGGTPENSPSST